MSLPPLAGNFAPSNDAGAVYRFSKVWRSVCDPFVCRRRDTFEQPLGAPTADAQANVNDEITE